MTLIKNNWLEESIEQYKTQLLLYMYIDRSLHHPQQQRYEYKAKMLLEVKNFRGTVRENHWNITEETTLKNFVNSAEGFLNNAKENSNMQNKIAPHAIYSAQSAYCWYNSTVVVQCRCEEMEKLIPASDYLVQVRARNPKGWVCKRGLSVPEQVTRYFPHDLCTCMNFGTCFD